VRGDQPLLAVDADLVEQDVAAVAQQLLVVEVDCGFQISALGCQLQVPAGMGWSIQDARNAPGRLDEPARWQLKAESRSPVSAC
jgi:hypothetical protein